MPVRYNALLLFYISDKSISNGGCLMKNIHIDEIVEQSSDSYTES